MFEQPTQLIHQFHSRNPSYVYPGALLRGEPRSHPEGAEEDLDRVGQQTKLRVVREHERYAERQHRDAAKRWDPDRPAPVAAGETVVPLQEFRARANSLVLRSTQAALAAAKGTGYVEGHPAGRWCREALFFLVWSCPQPVMAANLCELAGIAD